MAHNYTPSPVYHSPVVVADDGDAASAANIMAPIEQALDNAAAAIGGGLVKTLRTVASLTDLAALPAAVDEIALVSGTGPLPGLATIVDGIYVFRTPFAAPTPDGVNVVASTWSVGAFWYAIESSRINTAYGFPRLDGSKRLAVGPTAIAPYSAVSTFRAEAPSNTYPNGGIVELSGTTTVGQVPVLGAPYPGSFQWKVRQEYAVHLAADAAATWYAEDHDEVIGPTTVAAARAWALSSDYSALGAGAPKDGQRVRFVARHSTNKITVTASAVSYDLRLAAGDYQAVEFVWAGGGWVLSLGVKN